MEIIRAKNSGFCFGVKQAIDTTLRQIDAHEGAPDRSGSSDSAAAENRIWTYGQLIHNASVTDGLAEKGVSSIHDLDMTRPGDTIIVRSHGAPFCFYEEAEKHGLQIVDATCPFVSRIHKLVREAKDKGSNIIILGDPSHPEVIGINGWCDNSAYIIHDPAEAKAYPYSSGFLVCQTTLAHSTMDEACRILLDKGIDLTVNNTICNATSERQRAADDLSKHVDAMVVIGDRNSSNTKKLFDLCKKNLDNCFFVENIENLPLKELKKCNKIGVTAGASTPERAIKEVIAIMSENITNENISMADFMDDIDASLRLPKTGEIVTGTIDQVTENEVIVNLGCKKDGILMAGEVTMEEGQTLSDLFKVGDELEAKVIKTDDNDGGILLSKKKLEVNKHWSEITEANENETNIDVKVVRAVKGGVIASFKDVSGFIPMSQLDNKYVAEADEYIGKELSVKVTKVDQRRNRAVFSHKAVLNEERQKQVDEIWSSLSVGDIVEGTVMRFTDYGAFVDLGGIDGLLHISEISWGKLKHPEEVLKIDQKINVKILSMNREKGKISLGLKQTTPEPWSVIDEKYQIDQIVKGKVVQLKEYGAFIELEPGLDGLVHISEVANKRVGNIGDELTVGQEVSAKILDIDTERKRISLSIKEAGGPEKVEEAPAEEPAVEEAPAEEPAAEEAPAEEPAAEEAPAEEPAAEEAPAEEPAAEEAPAEKPASEEE